MAELDILDVANELGLRKGKDAGEEKVFFGKHDNETPDLWINPSKNRWYTYAGGQNKGGGYVNLVEHIKEIDRERAKEWLREHFPDEYSSDTKEEIEERKKAEEILLKAADLSHRYLMEEAEDLAETICQRRNFEEEDLEDAKIGILSKPVQEELEEEFSEEALINSGLYQNYEDDGEEELYCVLSSRITFPYFDSMDKARFMGGRRPFENGETYPEEWSRRFSEDKAKYKKTISKEYNRHILYQFRSEDSTDLVITEGFTDALSVKKCGYDTVTPATVQFRQGDIDDILKIAEKYQNIYIANDGDDAGEEGAEATAKELAKKGIDAHIVELPEGEDFDGFTSKNGYEVEEFLEEADSFIEILCERADSSDNRAESLQSLFEVVREWGKTERRELFEKRIESLNKAELRERYKEFLEEKAEQEDFDYLDYCDIRYNEDGSIKSKTFRPPFLSEDILNDFDFVRLRDSDQLLAFEDGVWKEKGETLAKKEAKKRLGKHSERNPKNEVLSDIEDNEEVITEREDFRSPDKKINLSNGVYDLEEEKLKPHSPEYNFLHKIPWRFNPEADCPEIDSFFDDVTDGDKEKKQKLYEIIGYTLLPSNLENKGVMFAGEGSNGKGITVDIIQKLLGGKNFTSKALHDLEDSFDINDLHGALALMDNDLSPSELPEDATARFKKLTGGDNMGAEIKFGDHYNLEPFAIPIFTANKIPPTQDNSDGFFRRWLIIRFPVKFKAKPNPNNPQEKQKEPPEELMKRLTTKEEMEGLLYKSIQAVKNVLNGDRIFTAERTTEDKRETWKKNSKPVVSFLQRFGRQGTHPDEVTDEGEFGGFQYDYVLKDDLKKLISAYAKDKASRKDKNSKSVSKQEITKALEEQMDYWYERKHTKQEPPKEDKSKDSIYAGIKIVIPEGAKEADYLKNLPRQPSKQNIEIRSEERQGSVSNRVEDFIQENYNTEGAFRDDILDEMIEEEVIKEEEREEAEVHIDEGINDGMYFEPDDRLQYL